MGDGNDRRSDDRGGYSLTHALITALLGLGTGIGSYTGVDAFQAHKEASQERFAAHEYQLEKIEDGGSTPFKELRAIVDERTSERFTATEGALLGARVSSTERFLNEITPEMRDLRARVRACEQRLDKGGM